MRCHAAWQVSRVSCYNQSDTREPWPGQWHEPCYPPAHRIQTLNNAFLFITTQYLGLYSSNMFPTQRHNWLLWKGSVPGFPSKSCKHTRNCDIDCSCVYFCFHNFKCNRGCLNSSECHRVSLHLTQMAAPRHSCSLSPLTGNVTCVPLVPCLLKLNHGINSDFPLILSQLSS